MSPVTPSTHRKRGVEFDAFSYHLRELLSIKQLPLQLTAEAPMFPANSLPTAEEFPAWAQKIRWFRYLGIGRDAVRSMACGKFGGAKKEIFAAAGNEKKAARCRAASSVDGRDEPGQDGVVKLSCASGTPGPSGPSLG
jgi:hypothetical protein